MEQDYPVDNQTYNLLQMLVSKLEAVEAYSVYEEDLDGDALQVVQKIAQDDRRHVDELLRLLNLGGK